MQSANGWPNGLFETWDSQARSTVRRRISQRFADESSAEEATQEAMTRAWQAGPSSFFSFEAFVRWCVRTAHNWLVDQYRKKRPTSDVAALELAPQPSTGVPLASVLPRFLANIAEPHQTLLKLRLAGATWTEVGRALFGDEGSDQAVMQTARRMAPFAYAEFREHLRASGIVEHDFDVEPLDLPEELTDSAESSTALLPTALL